MSDPAPAFFIFGEPTPPPSRQLLRAGPFTLDYDNGDLRGIKVGDHEVVRRIYAAVRDHNWGTVPTEITDFRSEIFDQSFRITYTSTHRQAGIHFVWHAELTGDTEGTLRFVFEGEAKSTFLRNRIGLCVLHPIRECAGAKCRARHANGTEKELTFPANIAVEQPVLGLHDLVGLGHEIAPGFWAEVCFTGEVFETEDQRNWIDASFKTFGTPLHLPRPVEITTGTQVRQSVELRLVGAPGHPGKAAKASGVISARRPQSSAKTVRIELPTEGWVRLPELGLGCSSNQSPNNFPNIARLKALPLSHLRADVKLANSDWGHHLLFASLNSSILGLPLELAVHLSSSGEIHDEDLRMWFDTGKANLPHQRLKRILVFQDGQRSTTPTALAAIRNCLGDLEVPIGAGTNADLYQLNLQRPPGDADFICWSMNPLVHASDTRSLLETPEAATAQIASVKAYFPGALLTVSPITLRPRFNPVATGAEVPLAAGELPPQVDPRQMSLVGAAWTVAMLAALAPSGVESLTFFETTGWRGVMETAHGSSLPKKFPSFAGGVFPMWHVFAALNGFRSIAPVTVSDPERVAALLVTNQLRQKRFIIANLTPDPLAVNLSMTGGMVRLLDDSCVTTAMREPESWWRRPAVPSRAEFRLTAFAIAFADVT